MAASRAARAQIDDTGRAIEDRRMSDRAATGNIHAAGGSLLWTIEVHGAAGQNPFFDDSGASLYATDGWGKAPAPTLRFRRFDSATGQEEARWPCGSTVRCAAPIGDGDLLVATDQRLARLDGRTLVERRRWDRSVKHANTIAVAGSIAVTANWRQPTITIVDLETGAVRRKRHAAMTSVVARPGADPLLVGGATGGIATIDPLTGTIHPLRPAPPALDAALSADQRALWLTTGIRVVVTERPDGASLRPGDATRWLESHPLGGGEPTVIEVPLPVRTVATAGDSLWLTPGPIQGADQFVLVRSTDRDDWHLWRPPSGQVVAAVSPRAGLALTSQRTSDGLKTTFACYRLEWP
jgi:hypothetical protein